MQQHGRGRAHGRQLVIIPGPADHRRPVKRGLRQGIGQKGHQLGPGNPHEQMAGPGRIDHGAQQIEQGTHPQLLAQRADILECRVEMRGEEEGEIAFGHHIRHRRGIGIQRDAQALQSIGTAAGGRDSPVAVLDHLVAHACQHQRGRCGAVEGMTAVTAGPHHIDARTRDAFHAHGAGQGSPGGVGQFQRAFSLHAQPHEEAPGLGRRQPAVHERPEAAGRHVRRQVFPPRQMFQHLGHAAVPSLPGQDGLREIAQQAQAVGSPRAYRAVGMANHRNPLPVLIPCHRVVFQDGSTCTGYAFGGPEVQRRMLEDEGVRFLSDGRVDMAACRWL